MATHSTVCGGHLQATDELKHFYSHAKYGDSMYENFVDCEWQIEAENNRNVQLTFVTFEIEEEKSCVYDFVEVTGSSEDFNRQIYGRFCGVDIPPLILSISDELYVKFRTDDTMGFKGFSASYVAVDTLEDFEEMNSDSVEVTPFPGSLKSIFRSNKQIDTEDEDEELEDPESSEIDSNLLSQSNLH